MTALDVTQQRVLAALLDAIHPSVPGVPGAVKAGVVDGLVAELDGPPWNGEGRYASAPFVHPDHPGHGWQGDVSPADTLARSLTAIDAWSRTKLGAPAAARAEFVASSLAAGNVPLREGVDGVDLFWILHRYVFERLHGEAVYGWMRPAAVAAR